MISFVGCQATVVKDPRRCPYLVWASNFTFYIKSRHLMLHGVMFMTTCLTYMTTHHDWRLVVVIAWCFSIGSFLGLLWYFVSLSSLFSSYIPNSHVCMQLLYINNTLHN